MVNIMLLIDLRITLRMSLAGEEISGLLWRHKMYTAGLDCSEAWKQGHLCGTHRYPADKVVRRDASNYTSHSRRNNNKAGGV